MNISVGLIMMCVGISGMIICAIAAICATGYFKKLVIKTEQSIMSEYL